MTSNRLSDLLREAFRAGIQPRKNIKFLDWCESEVVMPPDGPRGNTKFRLGPENAFMVELYEAVDNPRYTDHIVVKIPQIGGSTYGFNILQNRSVTLGKNSLYYTSTTDEAKKMMRREIRPRFTACKATSALICEDQDALTVQRIDMVNGTVHSLGGQSPNAANSIPSPTIFVDECDQIKCSDETNAHIVEMAAARQTKFPRNKKFVLISTATTKSGYIWVKYNAAGASRGRYHMTCPHCKVRQELTFTTSKTEKELRCDAPSMEDGAPDYDRILRETYYVCQANGCRIEQTSKPSMIRTGKWIHARPDSTIRSWQISGFLAPDYSWGHMLCQYLRFVDLAGGLRKFSNEFLGLPFEAPAVSNSLEDIAALAAACPIKYKRGELPFEPAAIRMIADTQTAKNGFFWAIAAYSYDHEIAIIDWGASGSFNDLTDIARREYFYQNDPGPYIIGEGMIDLQGDRTYDVYDYCALHFGWWYPSQGRGSLLHPIRYSKKEWKGKELKLVQFQDDTFKQRLYYDMIKERSVMLMIPQDYDQQFAEQMTNEARIELSDGSYLWVDANNQEKSESGTYQKPKNNHIGDCVKGALVFGTALHAAIENARLERMAEAAEKAAAGQ